MRILIVAAVFCSAVSLSKACTVTTVSGTHAPAGSFCSGDLLFEETFNSLDTSKWRHDITMGGGGNNEFQWYVNDTENSYTSNGNLHLRPTFTADIFGEAFLRNGHVVIPPDQCTQGEWNGCEKQATFDQIINPIRSARVDTWNSFRFKYGTLEIRAKMPAGDWIWPALWLMPRFAVYGGWPRSGEIDLMETRGNRNFYNGNTNIGVEQAGSTMHFGPAWNVNGYPTTHFTRNRIPGFNERFFVYKMIWTPTNIQFLIDNSVVATVDARDGFWARGGFDGSGFENPWIGAGIMAPFDQEFFVILNNAIGGTAFFSDTAENRNGNAKPWRNNSGRAAADFWEGRSGWESTWNRTTDDSHMQVDYVRVWAL